MGKDVHGYYLPFSFWVARAMEGKDNDSSPWVF